MADKWREIAGGFDQYEPDWPWLSGYEIAQKQGYKGTRDEWMGGLVTTVNGKQNKLSWDSEPTENSTKAISSGAVYAALQALKTELEEEFGDADLQPEEET